MALPWARPNIEQSSPEASEGSAAGTVVSVEGLRHV